MATVPAQSVLITGTSAGSIGSALAATFADHGLITFATARDISKIDASLSARPNVHTLSLDVTSQESISAAVVAVLAETDGKLDYLVNNAGVGYTTPLADVDVDTAKKVFDTNFWGPLSMTKAFMPLLVKSKGTIINISSVGAVVNTPWIGEFP
jgi:1-acylglycerone phosphate reductase